VQCVDAIDDLLERSVGDDAREHGVGIEQLLRLCRERIGGGAPPDARNELLVRHDAPLEPACGERAEQLVRMPASAGAENGDAHVRQ
jgi:hypothetical protein